MLHPGFNSIKDTPYFPDRETAGFLQQIMDKIIFLSTFLWRARKVKEKKRTH